MLIVEGPDGAGKTTLISKLSETLNWPVADRVVSKDAEPMLDLQRWVDDNLSKGWHETIYDRHRLISEPIYGPILKGTMAPGFSDLSWLWQRTQTLYRHVRPVIIYCLPPLEIVKLNVKASGKENARIAPHVEAIYGSYTGRLSLDLSHRLTGSASVIWYDYTKQSHTYEELLRKVFLGFSEGNF